MCWALHRHGLPTLVRRLLNSTAQRPCVMWSLVLQDEEWRRWQGGGLQALERVASAQGFGRGEKEKGLLFRGFAGFWGDFARFLDDLHGVWMALNGFGRFS